MLFVMNGTIGYFFLFRLLCIIILCYLVYIFHSCFFFILVFFFKYAYIYAPILFMFVNVAFYLLVFYIIFECIFLIIKCFFTKMRHAHMDGCFSLNMQCGASLVPCSMAPQSWVFKVYIWGSRGLMVRESAS